MISLDQGTQGNKGRKGIGLIINGAQETIDDPCNNSTESFARKRFELRTRQYGERTSFQAKHFTKHSNADKSHRCQGKSTQLMKMEDGKGR